MNVKKKRPALGRLMAVLAAALLMMTGAWVTASDAYAQDDDVTLKAVRGRIRTGISHMTAYGSAATSRALMQRNHQ